MQQIAIFFQQPNMQLELEMTMDWSYTSKCTDAIQSILSIMNSIVYFKWRIYVQVHFIGNLYLYWK